MSIIKLSLSGSLLVLLIVGDYLVDPFELAVQSMTVPPWGAHASAVYLILELGLGLHEQIILLLWRLRAAREVLLELTIVPVAWG